jgi:mono/diheme cytochrome c family protein
MSRCILALILAACAQAQLPNQAAIEGSGQNEDAVVRGAQLFADRCTSCHGVNAKGTTPATDLIRSVLVRDDETGERIGPVLRRPHPARLSDGQIADLVALLQTQVYAAANRGTYAFLDILTGDPKKGEQYFNGAGRCNTCHSPTGDLKGVGAKYDPPVLQSVWMNPIRRKGDARTARTVTVSLPGGAAVSGTLEQLDEFHIALRDAGGGLRTFTIDNNVPRIELHDPLQPHFDLYRKLTDADMHNVTAYLAGLQ